MSSTLSTQVYRVLSHMVLCIAPTETSTTCYLPGYTDATESLMPKYLVQVQEGGGGEGGAVVGQAVGDGRTAG